MATIQEQARRFLAAHNMDPEGICLKTNTERFLQEMEAGLKGEESSLLMLPTYISIDQQIPAGERAVVVDAGGTNFRVATVAVFSKMGRL